MPTGADVVADLQTAIRDYCHALHFGNGAVLDALCDDRFLMHWVNGQGHTQAIDKPGFVARVGGRGAAAGEPWFELLQVDVDADHMAQVKLNVRVASRVYTDQLGFLRVSGDWRLVTKLFRVAEGPAMEV